MVWLILLCVILTVIVILLIVKVNIMHKSIKEISEDFSEKLTTDTNTVISISSRDKHLKSLSHQINKELIELRKQRNLYQSGNHQLQESIINISHDIRTPLTAIRGYVELLEKEELTDRQMKYVEIIKNRNENLISLSEQLFDFSRSYDDARTVQKEICSLNQLLEESLASYYISFKERKIIPQIDIVDENIEIYADKEMILRVFANIISNALKYSDGDLFVSLDKNKKIMFSNHAKGLDEVSTSKLLNRYYTVESGKKSTGFGLSIAQHLIEQNDGTLGVEYEDGVLKIIIEMN